MLKFHLTLKNSKSIYKNKLLLAPLPERSLNKQRNIFKICYYFSQSPLASIWSKTLTCHIEGQELYWSLPCKEMTLSMSHRLCISRRTQQEGTPTSICSWVNDLKSVAVSMWSVRTQIYSVSPNQFPDEHTKLAMIMLVVSYRFGIWHVYSHNC